jgi:hypothetical protein
MLKVELKIGAQENLDMYSSDRAAWRVIVIRKFAFTFSTYYRIIASLRYNSIYTNQLTVKMPPIGGS